MKANDKFDHIDDDDIDDVIGIAAEMMQADDDALDRNEMIAVGRDLDIPEEYLDRAYGELVRRRKETERAERREAGRRRRFITLSSAGVGGVIVILISWGMFSVNGLSTLHRDVEAHQAQVANVVERKVSVERRWGDQPDSPDKMAALDGADNRIRVETKRYGEAAAAYNARAQRFPTSLFLSFSSLPDSVPERPELD